VIISASLQGHLRLISSPHQETDTEVSK